ncbi:MAG TPA: hypothetical protein VLG09_04295 [Candidatus Saccharimonadales bacterium]|nr:hypothetical protein [Candidatus Saccharimonadales bacterium]
MPSDLDQSPAVPYELVSRGPTKGLEKSYAPVYDPPQLPMILGSDAPQGGPTTTGNLQIVDSVGAERQTVLVSRTNTVDSFPSDTAYGIRIICVTGAEAPSQTEGITSFVLAFNPKDSVGISAGSDASGPPGNAFGAFFQAKAFTDGCHALAIQTDVQNNTGVASPYDGSSNNFIGIDLVFNSGEIGVNPNIDSGCAALIRNAGSSAWDVGFGFTDNSVKSTLIQENGNATRLWLSTGTHVDGFDLSGATFSGSQFKFAMSSLENAVNDAAAAGLGVPVSGIYRNGSILMVRVA